MRRQIAFACFIVLLGALGCAGKRQQLESVAKDWCMTIRASQVIPVYPLTQDIQPGDVFLVTTPTQEQHDEYAASGFLRLDLPVTRLHGFAEAYKTFYQPEFFDTGGQAVPHPALEPLPSGDSAPDMAEEPADDDPRQDAAAAYEKLKKKYDALKKALGSPQKFVKAAGAAFPAYSFSVDKSFGLNLALPISGVPVALSYMRTSTAVGTVVLRDAYTYGLPASALIPKIREWVKKEETARELYALALAHDGQLFLRIVSRVYLLRQVEVGLQNTDTRNAQAEAGMDLGSPGSGEAEASVENAVQLTKAAGGGTGGNVKFTSATQRAVALSETFPEPLVIGYLSFDMPILATGGLGVPVATQDYILDGNKAIKSVVVQVGSWERELRRINQYEPEYLVKLIRYVAARLPKGRFERFTAAEAKDIKPFFIEASNYVSDEVYAGGPALLQQLFIKAEDEVAP